jgi:hypothetical protein
MSADQPVPPVPVDMSGAPVISALLAEAVARHERCNGTGYVDVPATGILPGGQRRTGTIRQFCWDCHGRGRILTPAGQQLADALAEFGGFSLNGHGHGI